MPAYWHSVVAVGDAVASYCDDSVEVEKADSSGSACDVAVADHYACHLGVVAVDAAEVDDAAAAAAVDDDDPCLLETEPSLLEGCLGCVGIQEVRLG